MPFLADLVPRAPGLLPVDEHLVVIGAEVVGAAHGHRFERVFRSGLALLLRRCSSLGITLSLLHVDVVVVFGVAPGLPD